MAKFLFTNPAGWGVLAVSAIAAVVVGIKKYNDSIEEAKQKTREAADEAKSAVDSIKSDFETLSSDTDKVKERYAELSQQVENLGKANQSRGKLSSEDYEEFLGLSNQLVKLFPQLRAGCDDNGNAILNLSGNVDTIVGSLNNLIEVQQRLANQEIMKEMPDIWSGYMLDIKEYKEGLSYLEDWETQSKNAVEAISRIGDDKTLSIELYKNSQYQADEKAIDDIIAEAFKKLGYSEQDLEKIRNERIYAFMTDNGTRMQTEINWDLSSLDHLQFKQFQNELITLSQEYENTMMFAKSKIASANSEMVSYINTWLSFGSGEFNFNQMNSDMQNVVRDVLLNSDWISSIPDDVNADDWDAVSDWLQRDFLVAINNIDSEGIQTALVDAFKGNISADTLQGIVDKLMATEGFEENNPLVIYLQTKIEDRSNLEDDVKSKVRTEYRDMIASLSNGELQIAAEQIEVPEDALLSWDELIAKIEEIKKANITPATFDITTSKDQIDDIQSSISTLRSALKSLNSGSLDDSTVIDLMQEFPELAPYIDLTADGFGNLSEGLKTLIEQRPESLIKKLESLKDNLATDEERKQVDLLIGALQRLSNTEVDITSFDDSLDKFQSSVKSAADAYTTLLSGNYSSSELLDSIQAINKAASDMGKAIDWEAIAASDNPLQTIQDEIESISNTYAESVLSGAGIDTDSDFGKMLANIVQEAYKSREMVARGYLVD